MSGSRTPRAALILVHRVQEHPAPEEETHTVRQGLGINALLTDHRLQEMRDGFKFPGRPEAKAGVLSSASRFVISHQLLDIDRDETLGRYLESG